MKVTPLRAFVLVVLEHTTERTAGTLVLPQFAQQPSVFARVRAIGPDVRDVRVGARVIVSRLQGIEIADGVLLPESAVLAQASESEAPNP